jgi:tripartite-type tricarboxylate transporter receptor subunit TctC
LGVVPIAMTGAAFATFQQSELAKWGKAVRDAGIRID